MGCINRMIAKDGHVCVDVLSQAIYQIRLIISFREINENCVLLILIPAAAIPLELLYITTAYYIMNLIKTNTLICLSFNFWIHAALFDILYDE